MEEWDHSNVYCKEFGFLCLGLLSVLTQKLKNSTIPAKLEMHISVSLHFFPQE